MNIGQLAKQASVNIQTVRYYERIGILKPTQRRESGYRVYDASSLVRLRFIKRAQELGFTLDEIKDLLSLHAATALGRQKARESAKEKILSIQSKIADLKKMQASLRKLVENCEKRSLSSPCPILTDFE